jgi:hypothetical protein
MSTLGKTAHWTPPLLTPLLTSLLLPLLIAAAAGPAPGAAQEPIPVHVINLPEVQKVEGKVRVEEPVPHSRFHRIVDVTVPAGTLESTIDLVEAAALDVSGFTEASLSLLVVTGELLSREGKVGAWLVPAEERVAQVLDQYGEAMFPLAVEAVVTPGDGVRHFDSPATRLPLAFPRYRVLFYNGSAKAVTVSLFAYLTN